MDVVLINPKIPQTEANSFGSIQESITEMVPLGLLYIVTVLKQNGFTVQLIDLNVVSGLPEREACLDKIIELKPKLVGISVMTPFTTRRLSWRKE